MKHKANLVAYLIGTAVGALSYWFQPYTEMYAFGIHIWIIASVGALLGSLILTVYNRNSPSMNALMVTIGVVFAVILRIVYDVVFWDSTSHNLAPFEVIPIGVIAAAAAFLGAFLGRMFGRKPA